MMPTSALRECATSGCRTLVSSGHCGDHQRQHEQARGTFTQRGYGARWNHFRNQTFPALLLEHGLVPACGVALTSGPQTADSQCRTRGWLNTDKLELDHEPPLLPWERQEAVRGNRQYVDDPNRVQWLCATCHSGKTRREQCDSHR